MKLFENMLIRHEGKIKRIVFINQHSSILYVIEMEANRWVYPLSREQVLTDSNLIIEEDLYLQRTVAEEDLSMAEIKKRDQAWEIVQHVLNGVAHEEQIFITEYRETAIQKTLTLFDISYSSIKNYLLRFWKFGKTRYALLPNFHKCGAKGKEKKSSEKKRGRPRQTVGKQGINVDDKVKQYFRTGLNRYYYKDKQLNLKTTYEMIIKDFYTVGKMTNGVTVPIIEDISKIPSYGQFLYWFNKNNNKKKEISTRFGSRVYHQKYRAIIGNSTQDAGSGPATLWQTDSTPLDVTVVSSFDRNKILTSPLLHLVVDSYSRCIMGFSLSFESLNSYSGAMMALYNSMTPKQEFCRRYGIEITNEWDIHCIPSRILTDRGELNGKQIESAIKGLGISIQNSPSYRPETKSIIEQAFNQLTQRIKPHIDGAKVNGKRIRERGEMDVRLRANLTIDEVTAIIIRCIIFYNNYHVISDYVLDEEMIEAGVEKIPRKIWEFGVSRYKGNLRVLPEFDIKVNLFPNDVALVTASGVKYKKMLYVSDYSLRNNWFERARTKTWKIKIWYDPRDLAHVYTSYEDKGGFHELTLVEHLSIYRGKDIHEIEQIIKHQQNKDNENKERELQEKMKLFNEIEKIVQEGRGKTEAERNDDLSKTQRIKGIKENQRKERKLQRALNKEIEREDVSQEIIVEEETNHDDLSLFRSLQGVDEE